MLAQPPHSAQPNLLADRQMPTIACCSLYPDPLVQVHELALRALPRGAPAQHAQGHGEAALLLHRPHRHGHTERPREEGHAQRHLQLHHGALPLLQGQQTGIGHIF